MKIPLRYEVRVVGGEIITTILMATVFGMLFSDIVKSFNIEAYTQGLISFNSGIIIALFVALFHSADSSIVAFRKFKLAASQIYTILILNSILVCLTALFTLPVEDMQKLASTVPQSAGVILATICSGVNVYMIYRLLSVYFRK